MYRVVLVDDEKYVLVSLEKRIRWKEFDFEVVGKATSAEEGISLIRECQPDVVFTDIKMPGKGGIEMMKEIHRAYPHIRFVILSGYAEFSYAKTAMEYGASGYCVKPFEEEEIYDILSKIKLTLAQGKQNQNQIVDYLGCNDAEAVAVKEKLLQQAGLGQRDFKIVIYLNKSSNFETAWKYPMLHFAVNGQSDGYILNLDLEKDSELLEEKPIVNKRYNLKHIPKQLLDLKLSGPMGVSRAFKEISELEDAVAEAKVAYYQFFINGEPCGHYTGEGSYGCFSEQIKSLNKAIESKDLAGIKNIFIKMGYLISENKYTIETAYRVYNSFLSILGSDSEHENGLCSNIDELSLRYSDVKEMLSVFEEKMVNHITRNDLGEGVIYQIIHFINRNYYKEDLSIQTISQTFGFHPNYISQLFKKNLGETFTICLSRIRMEHAEQLLKFSNESIGEIAEKVGFSDYFYFAKVFKKYFGMTPSDYRKKL